MLLLIACIVRPASPAKEPVIAIALIGDARAPLPTLTPNLAETFSAEIIEAPRVALPASAWNSERKQYLSTKLLDTLASAKKPEWERLLGIADVDLYVPELNFVFGEADPRRGVAVFSMSRLRATADEPLLHRRAATEAVHELGHAYGLAHCSNPGCVMWFSNTLTESDRKGMRFCPEHSRELASRRARP
jgi:archaemetzincin